MQEIIITQEEKNEFKNTFETASKARTYSYKVSEIAHNTVYVNTISQFDDSKKVRFVIFLLSKDFRREDDYAFYFGILQNMFKKKMKMTEDDIMATCDIYHQWFDRFDAVGIKGFVKQALKNLNTSSSDEVKACLQMFCRDMENAEINFAPQRAKTRESTVELLKAYLNN
ncbi:hypothetical protein [Dysgonomonas sp. 511]|uniref:hypothetical protein n=1 Tax=Dysgonomonas sp. 511 TaxID=2302930 RepID=UPI0013D0F153|nr:hypothetical protein [Dysgonomonas sp. 511]NDV79035.1 hypothetical protein [Dysgonomonas sp. 511]